MRRLQPRNRIAFHSKSRLYLLRMSQRSCSKPQSRQVASWCTRKSSSPLSQLHPQKFRKKRTPNFSLPPIFFEPVIMLLFSVKTVPPLQTLLQPKNASPAGILGKWFSRMYLNKTQPTSKPAVALKDIGDGRDQASQKQINTRSKIEATCQWNND